MAFFLFAGALFVATHWPALEVRVAEIPRPDLVAHFGVFSTWYVLLFAAAFFGPIGRPGETLRTLGLPWLIAVGYAAFDEGLQLIPMIQRHAAWDDLAANIGGITVGLIGASIWTAARLRARGEQSPA